MILEQFLISIKHIVEQTDPNIILGISGGGLLAILISGISFVLEGVDEKKDFGVLDKNVVLKDIFRLKKIFLILFLIFLPPLLWIIFFFWYFQAILLVLWIAGAWLIVKIFLKNYCWLDGNRYEFRLDYLKKLKTSKKYKDLKISWRSMWQAKEFLIDETISPSYEEIFLQIFSDTINEIRKRKNGQRDSIIYFLFKDFEEFIDNRLTENFFHSIVDKPDFFDNCLDWHFTMWKEIVPNSPHRIRLSEAKEIIDLIIIKIAAKVIEDDSDEKNYSDCSDFFKRLKEHLEEKDGEEKRYSTKNIVNEAYIESISRLLFQISLSIEKKDIKKLNIFKEKTDELINSLKQNSRTSIKIEIKENKKSKKLICKKCGKEVY